MKKIVIILICLLLFTACSPRDKVELDENGYEITNKNEENVSEDGSEKDIKTKKEDKQDENENKEDEDKDKKFEGSCYKIENSGFEITVNENWTAIDVAAPMGAMLLRGGNMTNCANIVYATGDVKTQMENDLEGVFDGLKADKEINDYKITRSNVDGYYRILLTYNQINKDNSYTFSYVIYQQTKDGLLNISFQMNDQYPNEVNNMIESIRPQTDKAVDMPQEK